MSGTLAADTKDGPLTIKFDLVAELRRLLAVAFPSVALQFNMYFIYPQTASAVGRTLGSEALAGLSLGSLVGNITCLSIMIGVLGAADTLMPRAFGTQHYAELGRLVIRAVMVALTLLVIPVIPLCTVLQRMMDFLGQDPVAAELAADWIRIYLLGVPANLILRTLQRFLVAQNLPWPPVYATTIPSLVLFPWLVRVCIDHMGFLGSAVAVTVTQWLMLILLLAYLKVRPVYKKETWPGLTWSFLMESLRWRKMMGFVRLAAGGVMSLSEWWFWETSCFIAGSFDMVSFCAHSIAYNIIPLFFMIPLGFGIGVTVRVGQVLPSDPWRAKHIATSCLVLIFVLGCIVAVTLLETQDFVIGLFTKDQEVVEATRRIWPFVCGQMILEYVFGIQSAILRALAMQWRMGVSITCVLWFLLLPSILWFAVHKKGGLRTQWALMPVGYFTMQVVMRLAYHYVDWPNKSFKVRQQMEARSAAFEKTEANESRRLLSLGEESTMSA